MQGLRVWGFITAGLYALLLIPTAHLFISTGFVDAEISRQIDLAWHPSFFPILNPLSPTTGKILVHGLLFTTIALIAWVYYQASAPNRLDKNLPSPSFQQIFFWTSLFCILLLFVIPFHSKDIYGYINRGAQQAFYGINPYLHPLGDIENWQANPMFHEHWVDNPSPYGFFFNRLAHRLCEFSGMNFLFAFFLFKLNSVLLHLAITYLIYLTGHRLNLARPEFGALLYGWNPLMLLQIVGNGHNDLWVSFGLLLAIAMVQFPVWRWTIFPLLTVSVFTKYASILTAPFFLMALTRWRDWRALVIGIPLASIIILALGWPYLQDWQNLPFEAMAKNASMTQHSLNSMLSRLVYYTAPMLPGANGFPEIFSIEALRNFFKPLLWGSFALFFFWQGITFWRHSSFEQTYRAYKNLILPMAFVLVVMIAFASSKFHAWYIAMFFPLLFLLEENAWPRRFGLLLSYFQLLAFTPLQNIHILNYILLTGVPFLWSLGIFPLLARPLTRFRVK